jgi:hypothetical protein
VDRMRVTGEVHDLPDFRCPGRRILRHRIHGARAQVRMPGLFQPFWSNVPRV